MYCVVVCDSAAGNFLVDKERMNRERMTKCHSAVVVIKLVVAYLAFSCLKKVFIFFMIVYARRKWQKQSIEMSLRFFCLVLQKDLVFLYKREREGAADDPPHFFLVMTVCVRRTRASRASDSGSRSRASTALCWVQKKVRREKKRKRRKRALVRTTTSRINHFHHKTTYDYTIRT
jgi:hypothetical protein